MTRGIIISCFVLLFVVHAQAQNEETVITPRLRLGVEAGVNTVFGEANKLPMIRENHSSYYDGYDDDYYCGFIIPEGKQVNFFYLGLKPEYLVHKRVIVAVGVRFSFNKTVYDSDKDYFLWKISESEDGTNTNYLKIKDITQKNYYVGVPIEIKVFPRELDYFVRHYFIFGMALNFLATSTDEVSFKNPAMQKYASEITNQIGLPNSSSLCMYAGFGLKIGRTNHPFGNIQFHFPVLMFADDKPNSLVKTNNALGFGIQTSLQIPLLKKHQLVYVVND
jgi:hypothetical protein